MHRRATDSHPSVACFAHTHIARDYPIQIYMPHRPPPCPCQPPITHTTPPSTTSHHQADRRVEPRVEHLLSATQATAQRLRKSVDCYGDLLEEEGDAAELAKVC